MSTLINKFVSIWGSSVNFYGKHIVGKDRSVTDRVIDGKKDNMMFAVSMRRISGYYDGPILRLRRSSDNTEMDFYPDDSDIVDASAILEWASGSPTYMVKWYDQSGMGRDVIQPTTYKQPRMYAYDKPYFVGDANDDYMYIPTPRGVQDMITEGKYGTAVAVMKPYSKSEYTFGVARGSNRWSAHILWTNYYIYFDPGYCCAEYNRSYYAGHRYGKWTQFVFMRDSEGMITTENGIVRMSGSQWQSPCTITDDFGIGWAVGDYPAGRSRSQFREFIMYNNGILEPMRKELEDNAIEFWGIE